MLDITTANFNSWYDVWWWCTCPVVNCWLQYARWWTGENGLVLAQISCLIRGGNFYAFSSQHGNSLLEIKACWCTRPVGFWMRQQGSLPWAQWAPRPVSQSLSKFRTQLLRTCFFTILEWIYHHKLLCKYRQQCCRCVCKILWWLDI